MSTACAHYPRGGVAVEGVDQATRAPFFSTTSPQRGDMGGSGLLPAVASFDALGPQVASPFRADDRAMASGG